MGDSQEESAHLVCGYLACDAQPFNPLLDALPHAIHVGDRAGGALRTFVEFAMREAHDQGPGGEVVLGRLSELMFVDVVRRYLETLPATRTGWLSGLREPFVGRALSTPSQSVQELDARGVGPRGRAISLGAGRAIHSSDSRRCSISRTGGCSWRPTTC